MTQEEKAKAYDEALEKARKLLDKILDNELLGFPDQIRELFPVLAEREDERTRKWLYDYFSSIKKMIWIHRDITCEQILEWLEKQKEQKPVVTHGETYHVDTLGTQQVIAGKMPQKPAEWSEEDKEMLGKVLECIRFAEDRYQLEQEETNGVSVKLWLLDHIIPQQKPEWSEEDEKKIIFLERLIEHNVPDGQYGWVDGRKGGFVTKSEAISMLKSLRPQYHGDVTMTEAFKMGLEAGKASSWQPSEEDLMMLEHIIGQYETGNKNSKVMGYLPRIEELDFLKKVFAIWKS